MSERSAKIEFLLARITEDETTARAAIDPRRPGIHWQWETTARDRVTAAPTWEDMPVSLRTVEPFPTTSGVGDLPAFVLNHAEVDEPRALPHIARHDPARVLAECEAKRLTIETCRYWIEHQEPTNIVSADYILGATELAESILSTMADAWNDHADWREEFPPS